MCAEDLPAAERESFHGFARMLASLLHHRFHERIEALKDAYHPFNPEADTRTVAPLSRRSAAGRAERLEGSWRRWPGPRTSPRSTWPSSTAPSRALAC